MRKLQAGVYVLDKQYQMILIQNDLNEKWVCHYWLLLPLGIVCLILSLAWVAQMYFKT